MTDKSKYTGFRCPTELFDKLLLNSKNRSKIIVNALKYYKDKDFQESLLNAFTQYSKLFHLIEMNFKNRNMLGINEFINFIQTSITDTESIDEIERVIK